MRARINDLGTQGLVRDVSGYKLPNSAWTWARNLEFQDAAVRRFRGYEVYEEELSVAPLSIISAISDSGEMLIVGGTDSVYAAFEGSLFDISGDSAPYTATEELGWNGGSLGTIPVINNGNDVPQVWLDPSTTSTLEDLPNWPADATCRVLRPYKAFLVGYDWTINGTRYPQMVKWSTIAEPGTIPSTWDEGDPTQDAGEVDLGGTYDAVVDALPLRDINIIYKERSIWGMQFTATDDIFRFYQISSSYGIMSPDCVADTPRGHVVLTPSDLILNDGQNPRSIIDQRVREWLFSNLDPTNFQLSFLAADPLRAEVWIVFPSLEATVPDTALVWNWNDDTFVVRDADGFRAGAKTRLEPSEDGTWLSEDRPWAEDLEPWLAGAIATISTRIVFARNEGSISSLLLAGSGGTIIETGRQAIAEREGLPLRTAPQGPVDYERFKFVREVWPLMRDVTESTKLDIWVGAQETSYDSITWFGPFEYRPAEQQKINCRVSGRIISIRFSSDTDVFWLLDGYDVVYNLQGGY